MNGSSEMPGVAPEPGRREFGGRLGGLGGLDSQPVAEPTPAAGEAAAKAATAKAATRFRYRLPYRSTGMGGRDFAIGVCSVCKKLVRPIAVERSRTGRHGWDNYEHEHELTILVLKQSNSNKRSHYFENIEAASDEVKSILELAAESWEWYRDEVDEIRSKVAAMLKALRRG